MKGVAAALSAVVSVDRSIDNEWLNAHCTGSLSSPLWQMLLLELELVIVRTTSNKFHLRIYNIALRYWQNTNCAGKACASGSETSVSSSTPASAIIYDAYTSALKKKKIERKKKLVLKIHKF